MASNKRNVTPAAAAGSGSSSVDFVLRTAMERQSGNKRPIKPRIVDDTLLGDDSDDPDFSLSEQESGSGSDGSEDTNSDNSSESGSDDVGDDSEGHNDPSSRKSFGVKEALQKLAQESSDFLPPGKSKSKKKKKPAKGKKTPAGAAEKKPTKKNGKVTLKTKKLEKPKVRAAKKHERRKATVNAHAGSSIMDRVCKATATMRDIRSEIDLHRKICSFCLGEKSDESNEIVECDSCKVTVHEGCYGMSDSLSMSSGSGSSSATEPWFCDYCKNPDNRSSCALCPNPGGLLKATAEDQFVHLVCAHYTPGVMGFDNKTYLGRIPYIKWGNKPCALCSDARHASTGVTVKCDAGMCKLHVHISCAQGFGLLSDPSVCIANDEADPFFASCRLHGHKDQAKHRATLFKVLQEQIRIKREKSTVTPRIQGKLQQIRDKVAEKRVQNPGDGNGTLVPISVNGNKVPFRRLCAQPLNRKPRNLKSCAYAVTSFLHKIENMGEDITALELEEKHDKIVATIKKRWNILPSLTVEFVAYYFDREARIESLSKQQGELAKANTDLHETQVTLSEVLEDEAVDHMEIIDSSLTMDSRVAELKNILKALVPENKSINTSALLKGLPPRPKSQSPVRKIPLQPKGIGRTTKSMGGSELKKKTPARLSLPATTASGRLTVHVCAICKKSDQQHLITKCDHCSKNFHLGCLDPPLTRMPRRSRLVGWMCSDCCEEESQDEQEAVIDTEAPRSLRGRTQLKRPEKYRSYEESEIDVVISKERPSRAVPIQKPSPPLPVPTPVLVPCIPLKTGQDVRLKLEALQKGSSPTKLSDGGVVENLKSSGGVPLQYSTVKIYKNVNESPGELPATNSAPPAAKKMKVSQPTPSHKAKRKVPSKKRSILAVSDRLVPNLVTPKLEILILEEEQGPKKTPPKKRPLPAVPDRLVPNPTPTAPKVEIIDTEEEQSPKKAPPKNASKKRPLPAVSDRLVPNPTAPKLPIIDTEEEQSPKKAPPKNASKKRPLPAVPDRLVPNPTPTAPKVEIIDTEEEQSQKKASPKNASKKRPLPAVSNRLPSNPTQKLTILEEEQGPKAPPKKAKKSMPSATKPTKTPPKYPAINLIISDSNHMPALPSTPTKVPVSKKLKIVLSPVNSDHGANGISDGLGPHSATTGLLTSSSPGIGRGKKGTMPSPKLASPTVDTPRTQQKASARTKKVADKDKSYFNSLNMSGQIAMAINYNNYATNSSGVSGKCSVCKKMEDKKNLVMCDDCNLEFHFTCVPPFMPYNPKRRGYEWICKSCDSSDEEGNLGEIRENVSRVSH